MVNLTTAKKSVLDEKQLKRFENFLDDPPETTQLVLILMENWTVVLKLLKN
ncbi:hypothetical protein [Klebsiella pneumoniae]|uniref:hypothetical protein n=1 Tax=Klebsiella pneumoniae TaxID=573 RepID=UPI0034DE3513